MSLRRVLTLGGVVLVLAAAAGCNADALSKREIVVHFTADATDADHRAAQAACATAAPHVSPEPIVHTSYASTRVADVRFRVDHANDNDLAKLYVCLGKQRGVLGVSDPMDMTR